MMRFFVVGLAGVGAALAGNYAITSVGRKSGAVVSEVAGRVDFVKLDPVSVPIIRSGSVDGYVITRVAVAADESDAKKSKQTIVFFATEAVFRAVHAEGQIDFMALKPLDIDALSERILKMANAKLGGAVIKSVAIENINFVRRSETR